MTELFAKEGFYCDGEHVQIVATHLNEDLLDPQKHYQETNGCHLNSDGYKRVKDYISRLFEPQQNRNVRTWF